MILELNFLSVLSLKSSWLSEANWNYIKKKNFFFRLSELLPRLTEYFHDCRSLESETVIKCLTHFQMLSIFSNVKPIFKYLAHFHIAFELEKLLWLSHAIKDTPLNSSIRQYCDVNLKTVNTIVPWCSRGFTECLQFVMPRDASLSESCTCGHYSFSSLFCHIEFLAEVIFFPFDCTETNFAGVQSIYLCSAIWLKSLFCDKQFRSILVQLVTGELFCDR